MQDPSQILTDVYSFLFILALALARPGGMFFILPLITRLGLPDSINAAVVLALSLPTVQSHAADIGFMQNSSNFMLVAMIAKETVIGLLLGLLAGTPFWAMEMAGNILEFQREAPNADVQDPNGTTEASVTGTLFVLFAVVYAIAAGGLATAADLLYQSYHLWPIIDFYPTLHPAAGLEIMKMLHSVMKIAFLLAAPLMLPMLLALFALMITTRLAPQLNAFDLSLPVRNIAFFALLPFYAVFAADYFVDKIPSSKSILDTVKALLS